MPGDGAALLWLRAFQRLAERAAHEIKNPLNGAVLNTEVIRGRVGRSDASAGALAPYAAAAAAELARAAALVEALLALARPVAEPVDLDRALAPLVVLARAVAEAGGGSLTVDRRGDGPGGLADGDAVRGAVAAALDAAVRGDAQVTCAVGAHEDGVVVRIGSSAGPVTLAHDMRAAIQAAGVRIEDQPGWMALVFARDGADVA